MTWSHLKLVHVLKHFKLESNVVDWIKNYLSGRKQMTVVNNQLSEPEHIASGVPQGSVLGPLLFLLYIEDLITKLNITCKNTKVFAFADDLKLLSNDHADLQTALDLIGFWVERWQLLIQPAKSEHINFSRGQDNYMPNCKFIINGNTINTVQKVKDLGLYISNDLKWNSYIEQTKYKADRLANILLRTFKTHDLKIYKTALKTYIRPIVEYNSSIWSPYHLTQIRLIESVQKAYTKRVCKKLNITFSSYNDRLSIMEIDSLEYRRLKCDLILLYKILNKTIHVDTNYIFFKSHIQGKYNLRRNSLNLQKPPLSKTAIRTNFFCNRVIKTWNKLPDSLVTSPTLSIFKARLNKTDLKTYYKFLF